MSKIRIRGKRKTSGRLILDEVEAVLTPGDLGGVRYWHAFRTPGGKELDAAIILTRMGQRVYAPTVRSSRRIGNGLRLNHVTTTYPVFARYAFMAVGEARPDWYALFKTGYVRGVIGLHGRPYEISNKDIRRIETMRSGEMLPETEEHEPAVNIEEGEMVRIDSGPFTGHYGPAREVDRARRRLKVLAHLFRGQEVPVELTLDQVTKAA